MASRGRTRQLPTRRGPGRPRELGRRKVLVSLDEHLLDWIERYRKNREDGVLSRSAALREILERVRAEEIAAAR
jgi:hypothetical protein